MSKTARAGSRRPIVRPEEHTLDTLIHDCTGGDIERLRREFRRVDADGRGKLTEARFKAALRNAGLSAPGHLLDRAVGRAMDYGAGLVDYERFISSYSPQNRPSASSKHPSLNSRLYDDAYAATELQTTSDAIARKVAAATGQPEPSPAGLTSVQLSQHPRQRLESTVPVSDTDSAPPLTVPRAARTAQKVVISKLSTRGPPSKVFRTVFDQRRRGTLEYGEFLTGIRRAGIPSDQVTDHECELLFKATAEHGHLTLRGFDSLFTLGPSEDTVTTNLGTLKRPYDPEPNEMHAVQQRIARSTRDPGHDLAILQQRESPTECPVEELTPQSAPEPVPASAPPVPPDTMALATALRRKLQQAIATKYSSQQAAATAASEVDSLTGRRQLTQESMTRFLRRMLPNATEKQIQLVIEQVQNAEPENERGEYALFREDPDTTYHARADERVLSQVADIAKSEEEGGKSAEVVTQSYVRDKRGRCRSVDNITAVMNTEANKNYKEKLFTEKAAPEGAPHRNNSTVTGTFEFADYPSSVQPDDFTSLDTSALKKRRAATARRLSYNRSIATAQESTSSNILEIRRALLRDARGGRTLARGLQEVAKRASDAYDFHAMLQDYVPNNLEDGQVKALIKCSIDPLTSRVDSERLLSTLNLTVEGVHSPTTQPPMRCGDESGDFFHTTVARSQLRPSSNASKIRSQTPHALTHSTVGEQLAPPTEADYQLAFSRRPRSNRTMDSSGIQSQLLGDPELPTTVTHTEPRRRSMASSSTANLFRGEATTRPISCRSSRRSSTTANSKGDLFGASVSDAYADFGPRRRSASICQDSSGIWETFGLTKAVE